MPPAYLACMEQFATHPSRHGAEALTGLPMTGTRWAAVVCLSMLTFVLIPRPRHHRRPGRAGHRDQWRVRNPHQPVWQCAAVASRPANGSAFVHRPAGSFGRAGGAGAELPIVHGGRALVGVVIGGFWSLSTAILARLATAGDLPKAMAMLQGGTALAALVAAPLGSLLGGLFGWRGAS